MSVGRPKRAPRVAMGSHTVARGGREVEQQPAVLAVAHGGTGDAPSREASYDAASAVVVRCEDVVDVEQKAWKSLVASTP
jgi:hypothetical protein